MGKGELRFDKAALDQAERDYKNVFPKGIQSDIIQDLIGIAIQYIPISRDAMGGIFIKAIAEWQKSNKKELGDLINVGPDERLAEVTKIMNLVRDRLINLLSLVSQGKEVQKAFEKAHTHYKEKYAER